MKKKPQALHLNKKQRAILKQAEKTLLKLMESAAHLEALCEDNHKQHFWDEWRDTTAYARGFAAALSYLNRFIAARDESK